MQVDGNSASAGGSLNKLVAPTPVQNPQERDDTLYKDHYHSSEKISCHAVDRSDEDAFNQDCVAESNYTGLNEVSAPSPLENPGEKQECRTEFLEDTRSREQTYERDVQQADQDSQSRPAEANDNSSSEANTAPRCQERVSTLATQLYVVSYLIVFSILGTLARLGIETLTAYPDSPLTISVLWANLGGSLLMGFLSEDRKIFTHHENAKSKNSEEKREDDVENGIVDAGSSSTETPNSVDPEVKIAEAKRAHSALKRTVPLYIGLTTGFCGSFTSFSSFMRDCFLALSNEPLPSSHSSSMAASTASRNGGYSFMAVVAVIILTVSLCISALQVGAHLAIAIERVTPSIPVSFTRKILDRSAVVIAWSAWLATIFIAIWPPDRASGPVGQGSTNWTQNTWWGETIFALIFAPVGCLLRFYASVHMNSIFASFPLGTFAVNIFGTAVLGMSQDLQHAPLDFMGGSVVRSVIGCRVLQGIQDGFCGCLTTVSTWVLELAGLRRKHSYIYGMVSITIGLALLVIIMGSLAWSRGFSERECSAS